MRFFNVDGFFIFDLSRKGGVVGDRLEEGGKGGMG